VPGWLTRLLPYTTVVIAAIVPLAAGIYLLTTTAWTTAERALLRRRILPSGMAGPGGQPGGRRPGPGPAPWRTPPGRQVDPGRRRRTASSRRGPGRIIDAYPHRVSRYRPGRGGSRPARAMYAGGPR
jgi:hypothetical protein